MLFFFKENQNGLNIVSFLLKLHLNLVLVILIRVSSSYSGH